jgi:type I site-specific restriction endonuclease
VDDGGKYALRHYQEEAIEAVLEGWAEGKQRQLIAMATGAGKVSQATNVASKQQATTRLHHVHHAF